MSAPAKPAPQRLTSIPAGRQLTFAFTTGLANPWLTDPARRFWPVAVADVRTAAAAVRDDADPYSDCFDPWGDSPEVDGGHL